VRVGILSTYPSTSCGLATFSAALARGIEASGSEVRIVRVIDGPSPSTPPGTGGTVVGELLPGSSSSATAAAHLLGDCDVAIVQHEYGVFGGPDGDDVLAVLGALRVPAILVAHTVLQRPTGHQRSVLIEATRLAAHVVVMSRAARDRLCEVFGVDPARVSTIPHGAAAGAPGLVAPAVDRSAMLTWGLVGPGKGMERVIDVLPALRRRCPTARYVIAGRTHPKVLAAQGEAYRTARARQAVDLGVADAVHFDPGFRDVPALDRLVRASGVVVLPYDSADQVTSGVLVDAVAAGRPVVATAFPHAVELLASGAGIVVDHDDPAALELALARVLTRPRVARRMAQEAARLAPGMGWPVVARRYLALSATLVTSSPASAPTVSPALV
jgi:glycosyltransferase involved in cell wall biosynthesis